MARMGRRVVPDAPSDDDVYHVSLTPRESSWRRILGRRTVEFVGSRIHKIIVPVEQQKMDATLRYLRHLRSVQEDHVNWMRNGKQPHLTVDLRAKVVEWMLIVGTNRSFGSETLFLAVNLFDAYLSRVSIKAYEAQPVAAACLFLAMKATKLVPPGAAPFDVLDRNWRAGFDRVCRAGTAREDIAAVLHAVDTCVGTRERPTAATFLNVYIKHTPAAGDLLTVHLSTYICERLLADYHTTLYWKPHEIAAAALLITRRTLGQPWTAHFVTVTNFSPRNLAPMVEFLMGKLTTDNDGFKGDSSSNSRIVQKYATAAFMEVASIRLVFH